MSLRALYPALDPYETGMLETGDGHSLYWEQSGNPDGVPIVFLHGGPGSGSQPWHRQLFNPEKYRIILFDQRGAGKSTPHASIENNTTQHLVEDMEALRQELGVQTWSVIGGSWGSTLALTYVDQYADRINDLVVYGVFLSRESELQDLYFEGGVVSHVFPDLYERLLSLLPIEDRHNPLHGYQKLFAHPNQETRFQAAEAWTRFELQILKLVVSEEDLAGYLQDQDFVLAFAILENHYFLHQGFIDGDALLQSLPAKLSGKTIHVVQGRYDMVCPVKTAWDLHKALSGSQLHIIKDAGHSAREPQTASKLITILDTL